MTTSDYCSPRWILHIDMDAFYASCEQLTRPTLRGRPVLVGGSSGRGVVAGASYEARAYGAHSAMPTYVAARMVGPTVVVVTPRRVVYTTASARVFEIIERNAGLVEKLSIDEGYIEPEELAGASQSEVRDWAENLRAVMKKETGLSASIGAGAGKQYAKIGSGLAKPDGVRVLPPQLHEELIYPLPATKLWGVGPVTAGRLSSLGIESIADLAQLDEKEVRLILGDTIGPSLWTLARGRDDRPVAPRAVAKSVGAEHTYPSDLRTRVEVDEAFDRSFHDAFARLRKDGRGARTVSVKTRMSDFHIESRSQTLSYATDDAETLRATALNLVRYPVDVGPIRLIGVTFSGLEKARQDVLFPELDQTVQSPHTSEEPTYDVGTSDGVASASSLVPTPALAEPPDHTGWRVTQDVTHPEYGHGWVQGCGRHVVTVRFETRATGPGRTRTFDIDDPDLAAGDPLDSLAWEDWLSTRAD